LCWPVLRFDHGAHFLKPATDHTGNGQYSQTYQYNAIGNITSTSRSGNYSYSSSGAASVRPHAVISTTGGYSYTYDANGNMLTRIELSGTQRYTYTQQWDVDNRLIAVTNTVTLTVTRFYYDGDGQRVKRVESKGGTTITTAYAGVIEVTISGTQRITQAYYLAGAQRVATRVITSTGSVVYYIHADHLGSASLTTDASGNKIGELRYMPYGETRYVWGSTPTDRRFTGQREEAALGSLYDYGARFYSPSPNRFISPDTIVPSPGNPQALNRYTYTLGNPLKYTDPTGHKEACGANGVDCERDQPPQPPTNHANDPLASYQQQSQRREVPTWKRNLAAILSAGAFGLDVTSLGLSSVGVLLEAIGLAGGLAIPDPGGAEVVGLAAAYKLYQPLNRAENDLGVVSFGMNFTADWLNGETYPERTELYPGVYATQLVLGQDTTVSLVAATAGYVPEPFLDSALNLAIAIYDYRRMNGDTPAVFQATVGVTDHGRYYMGIRPRKDRP
jgi:RHS repeat-associated protein